MTKSAAIAEKRSARSRPRVVPGQPDMWLLVFFEAFVFTSYFIVYLIRRNREPLVFLRSQEHLSQDFGVVNTLILLISSWSMARCVQSARAGRHDRALRQALVTLGCGIAFAAAKIAEWTREILDGYTFTTNSFFQFYFFLTGIHVVHVLIGFIMLGVVIYQLRSPARRSQEIIETGATYWHMVDFLWVMIFALLYVMR